MRMADDNEESAKDTIYDEEARDEMVDDDEMSPGEAGFMEGYDEDEEEAKAKKKKKSHEEGEEPEEEKPEEE